MTSYTEASFSYTPATKSFSTAVTERARVAASDPMNSSSSAGRGGSNKAITSSGETAGPSRQHSRGPPPRAMRTRQCWERCSAVQGAEHGGHISINQAVCTLDNTAERLYIRKLKEVHQRRLKQRQNHPNRLKPAGPGRARAEPRLSPWRSQSLQPPPRRAHQPGAFVPSG